MTSLAPPSLLVLPLQSSSTGSILPSRTTSYVRFVFGSSAASMPSSSQSNHPCAVPFVDAAVTVVCVSPEYRAGLVVSDAVTSPFPAIVSKAGSFPLMQPQPCRVIRSSSTTSNDTESDPQSAETVSAAPPDEVPRTDTVAPSSETLTADPITDAERFETQEAE